MTTITIDIPEPRLAALAAKAKAQGMTLQDWFRRVAEREAAAARAEIPETGLQKSPEEWERRLDAFLASLPKTPVLPDEAIAPREHLSGPELMPALADTNASPRILQTDHPRRRTAVDAVRILTRRGEELCVVPQNPVEIWAVATRPAEAKTALAWTRSRRRTPCAASRTSLLADTDDIHSAWEAPVIKHRVSGKTAHDARIVAAMQVHGQTSILTFDESDFARYPGIEVVHPAETASNG